MQVVFFGSSDFGLPALRLLADHGNLVGVVTTKEKPKGRGLALQPGPIRLCAQELNWPVSEPDNPNAPEFLSQFRALKPDLIVLAAYRFILAPELLAIPSKGCLNLHPSLLPRYRGAAPIQRALMAGESQTGVTVFLMNEKLDQGDVLMQRSLSIAPNETCGELSDRLAELSAEMLRLALPMAATGRYSAIPQDSSLASYAHKIIKEERLINWDWPARQVHNLIRALSPIPAAYTFFRGKRLEILGSECADQRAGAPEELQTEGHQLFCGTGSGCVLLTRVKPEGGRLITALDLLNGYRIKTGERVTSQP
jgi:methionyl-tRNA formyltransferase